MTPISPQPALPLPRTSFNYRTEVLAAGETRIVNAPGNFIHFKSASATGATIKLPHGQALPIDTGMHLRVDPSDFFPFMTLANPTQASITLGFYVGFGDVFFSADAGAGGLVNWDDVQNTPTTVGGYGISDATASPHALTGADHSVAGLTTGHFLKATGATTFGFGAHGLTASDVSAAKPANVQVFSTPGSFTWTKPAGAISVHVCCIAGGGGGGSGRKGAAGTAWSGGSGASGASLSFAIFPATACSTTENLTVGAGGAGGASVSTDSTDGNDGTNGGNSVFGNLLRASAAYQGLKGSAATSVGGIVGPRALFTGTAGGNGTLGDVGAIGSPANCGAGGGGGGGGISAANVWKSGGDGSACYGWNSASNGIGGATEGTNGTNGTSAAMPGTGGGGGASSTTGNAGNGGNGGSYGAGGGGGGAAHNGIGNSGAGGNGAGGLVIVTTYF